MIQNRVGNLYIHNGNRMFRSIDEGNCLTAMEIFFAGLLINPETYIRTQLWLLGGFSHWMANVGYTSMSGLNPYALSPAQYSLTSLLFGTNFSSHLRLDVPKENSLVKFYGTPLLPFLAFYIWIFGNGTEALINIRSLNLKLQITDFKPKLSAIKNNGYGPGTYPILSRFYTDLSNSHPFYNSPAALTLGRVSGEINGKLVLDAAGNYDFHGRYSLYPDQYDANRSNSRKPFNEKITTIMSKIGNIFGHSDYTIVPIGEQEIHLTGKRN